MKLEPGKSELDVNEIQQLLPHRYPMLMIDRLVDIVAGESGVGIKNVTYNEPFFPGHFPQAPVMPGVLIVEAMAQAAAAYTSYTCLLYTSPSPRDLSTSRMPSSA